MKEISYGNGDTSNKENELNELTEEIHSLLAENEKEQQETEGGAGNTDRNPLEKETHLDLNVQESDPQFSVAEESLSEETSILEEQSTAESSPKESEPSLSNEKPSSPKEHKTKKQKKVKVLDIVFYGALIVLVLGILLIKSGGNGAPVSIAGFSIHRVLTSSMQDEIPKDSLVLTRQVDPSTLQIGDDITYMRNETTTITHRIVGIIEDYASTGQRAFETQGIMNKERDTQPVPAANVVGKVIFHNYVLGIIMNFFNQYWYLVVLFLLLFCGLFTAIRSWWRAHQADKKESAQRH